MNKIKILIEGYAKKVKDGWRASSSCILIKHGKLRILVDPGTNRRLLLKKLQENKLSITDIHIVYLTHYHLDHSLLTGIFKNSKVLDYEIIFDKDLETEYEGNIPNTDIQVVPTRGHALEHSSLLVPTENGIVAVAGDVFWWTDEEEQITSSRNALLNHKDPFVKNLKQLQKSRLIILKSADFVIPGHGKKFVIPRK